MCDYKTGDLIVVEGYREPRVFLYYLGNEYIVSQKKTEWERNSLFSCFSSSPSKVSKYTPKQYVKDPVTIMKWLVDNGYKIDRYGDWCKVGEVSFITSMWKYCGKEKPNTYTWNPDWIEER